MLHTLKVHHRRSFLHHDLPTTAALRSVMSAFHELRSPRIKSICSFVAWSCPTIVPLSCVNFSWRWLPRSQEVEQTLCFCCRCCNCQFDHLNTTIDALFKCRHRRFELCDALLGNSDAVHKAPPSWAQPLQEDHQAPSSFASSYFGSRRRPLIHQRYLFPWMPWLPMPFTLILRTHNN